MTNDKEQKGEFTITVFWSEVEGRYMYDIYDKEIYFPIDEDDEPIDGGCCTGSLVEALEMASSHTKELIKQGKIKGFISLI